MENEPLTKRQIMAVFKKHGYECTRNKNGSAYFEKRKPGTFDYVKVRISDHNLGQKAFSDQPQGSWLTVDLNIEEVDVTAEQAEALAIYPDYLTHIVECDEPISLEEAIKNDFGDAAFYEEWKAVRFAHFGEIEIDW